MKRLNTRVAPNVGRAINEIMIDLGETKGKVLRMLVDLAIDNPDKPLFPAEGEPSVNCTLTIGDTAFDAAKAYRTQHDLARKTEFLRDAIQRGLSVYFARAGGSSE